MLAALFLACSILVFLGAWWEIRALRLNETRAAIRIRGAGVRLNIGAFQ